MASSPAPELHHSQVRRALFENAELRRYAMAIGWDERGLQEIGELMERRAAKKSPRRRR